MAETSSFRIQNERRSFVLRLLLPLSFRSFIVQYLEGPQIGATLHCLGDQARPSLSANRTRCHNSSRLPPSETSYFRR